MRGLSSKTTIAITIVCLGLLLAVQPAIAQSPVISRVDRTTLTVDEQLTLSVTVSGDFLTIPRPDLAQLQDFVVVSSSSSTQVSIINGKMTTQGIFSYRLQPLNVGTLLIPPVAITLDGQLYETEPMEIEVLPSGSQPPPDQNTPETEAPQKLQGQDFLVEAEVSKTAPYLGEQIIYTFRLYQAVNFFGQPDYASPAFTDFWSSEILAQPHFRTEAGGRTYQVTEILTALFPAKLGEITIDPARLIIPGGLLSQDVRLETNPVMVTVKPLPNGAPADFSGAVGEFEISAQLSQTESRVNEPITLIVTVEGVGNIETLTEPELTPLPGWRYFESQATTQANSNDGVLQGSRIFERLIVPGQAGQQTFPAITFSYYNPNQEAYETLRTDPIPMTILPDDASQPPLLAGATNNKQPVELVATDIGHIKPLPGRLTTPATFSAIGQIIYWGAWIVPLFVMGGAYVWKRKQLRLEHDPAYARSITAKKRALQQLSTAQRGVVNGATAADHALLGYLSDRLNTPLAGLTAQNLQNVFTQSRLTPKLVERITNLLAQIEIGRYAPVSSGGDQAIVTETRQLINDLEKFFGKPQ